MKVSEKNKERPPAWFVVLLVVMTLPLLAYPVFWSHMIEQLPVGISVDMWRFLICSLPVYVVVSQLVCYHIYRERKSVVWILQTLLLLTYLACAGLYIL